MKVLQTFYMQVDLIHASGSGRARRDAAARAMQGWHSQRLLGNGEVGDPIIKVLPFLFLGFIMYFQHLYFLPLCSSSCLIFLFQFEG